MTIQDKVIADNIINELETNNREILRLLAKNVRNITKLKEILSAVHKIPEDNTWDARYKRYNELMSTDKWKQCIDNKHTLGTYNTF